MKKLLLLLPLVLTGCASPSPYGTGQEQGYFLGPSAITSNVPNLCLATNTKYAFVARQYWLSGGASMTWFGCSADHQMNLQPQYMVDYSIIKNDGMGKNVVATCTPVYSGEGSNLHFTQMNVVIQLKADVPTCQEILT